MRQRRPVWIGFPLGLLMAVALGYAIASEGAAAMPLISPTPDPNTINQPYVTFQHMNPLRDLFRFDSGVPISLTILILVILLGLASIYIRSTRSRH